MHTAINVVILLMLITVMLVAGLQIFAVRREQHISDVARALLTWRPSWKRRNRRSKRGPRDW